MARSQMTLPIVEFAFPGPLRDRLVAAVLDGSKTSTTSLFADYRPGEELPVVGRRGAVVDSDGRRVAVLETTEVRVVPLGEVDLAHCVDEGEGFTSIAEWRADHTEFWLSPECVAERDDPAFTVDNATLVLLERFRAVANP
ncbi:uncharacterized protein YhfF [Streptacidiphilus sp. BW17]